MVTKGDDGYVRLDGPVRAIKVADAFKSDVGMAGCFNFEPKEEGIGGDTWGHINFTCPCGCGLMYRLVVGLKNKPTVGARPTWQWDGNEEEPTIHPSVDRHGHWHGWLQKGYFRDA